MKGMMKLYPNLIELENIKSWQRHISIRIRMNKTKRGSKFCPRCGSTDVFWASGLPQLWGLWDCKECGYRGAFIIEDGELAMKIREDYLKKNQKNKD